MLQIVGNLPWFDLPLIAQISGEKRASLLMQLSRWSAQGKLIPLRRGMYILADPYRKTHLSLPGLANALYGPSYLTGYWCLGFYGLIPEKVSEWTSVTTRVTRTFHNSLGRFHYFQVKPELFRGFAPKELQGVKVLLASPEKAFCDFIYLTPGKWSSEQLKEMRFQNLDLLDFEKLAADAAGGFPRRVLETAQRLRSFAEEESEGEREV